MGDILELGRKLVRMKNGDQISTDVLLCGTGWKSTLGFFDQDLLVKLDLPYPAESKATETEEQWAQLEKEADQKVLEQFPQLANPPSYYKKPTLTTPYRLYKGIAPLSHDSIVFIGHVLVVCLEYLIIVGSIPNGAGTMVKWFCFFFARRKLFQNRRVPSDLGDCLSGQEASASFFGNRAIRNRALLTAWCRRRYLSNGEKGNWMVFETSGYTDRLLQELGSSSHRKSWFQDYFMPGTSQDLLGLREEYVAKYGSDVTERGAGHPSASAFSS